MISVKFLGHKLFKEIYFWLVMFCLRTVRIEVVILLTSTQTSAAKNIFATSRNILGVK
jgi:hypothetical protein